MWGNFLSQFNGFDGLGHRGATDFLVAAAEVVQFFTYIFRAMNNKLTGVSCLGGKWQTEIFFREMEFYHLGGVRKDVFKINETGNKSPVASGFGERRFR